MFEDCLGLRRRNGRPPRGRTVALAVSLVLHGLLIYGFVHARFTIKMLAVRGKVEEVRIVPPVRFSVPRVVGARAQGRPVPETAQAEAPAAGTGGAGRTRRASAPPPPTPGPPAAAASAAPGPAAQGPVIPSLATKFRESLASRYRTGQGSDLTIALAPPGTKPSAGAPAGKAKAPDFFQYLSGGAGTGEAGAGTGTGPGGGAGGQRAAISIALKGYNLSPWAQKVLELIMKNWQLPYAPGLAERTRVKVIVVVKKSGELASIELAEGSARDVLDEAALGAVRGSLPFPALPDDFPGDFLEASIEFTYHD